MYLGDLINLLLSFSKRCEIFIYIQRFCRCKIHLGCHIYQVDNIIRYFLTYFLKISMVDMSHKYGRSVGDLIIIISHKSPKSAVRSGWAKQSNEPGLRPWPHCFRVFIQLFWLEPIPPPFPPLNHPKKQKKP